MNWLKRKFLVLRFQFWSKLFERDLRRNGVPTAVIAKVFLAIAGEYPVEQVREELARYDVKI
jgi:hypothetical protein